MKTRVGIMLFWGVIGMLWAAAAANSQTVDQPHAATSTRGMVASVHPVATDAGVDALRRGGNAVDAAIATALTLGVVDGYNSGIGGGCFILIRRADGSLIAIDGREMAPAAAHRDMYLVDGKPSTQRSQIGPLACGVPGALAAYAEAVRDHGRLALSDLLGPAADVAENGFKVSQAYSNALKGTRATLQQFPETARVLLKPDGTPYEPGEVLRQPELARTYRQIASHGTDWFYRGEFAKRTAEWMQQHGGILTAEDFQNYHTVRRKPVVTTYRGLTIVGFPPPSSGGVHVAEILNILESFDLADLDHRDPAIMRHVVAEAMKLAFADRAYWLGDPDYVNVPRGLIDREYAAQLASRIQLDRTIEVTSHGTPPRADSDFFEKHTTHIAAADADGNWVALTTTVNTTFGSKVIVPGLGVVMNNQMDDFSIAPGVPNAFGLVGAEANAIAPGKRPLSSMSPTIVLRGDQPVFSIGAAGGPKIITQAVWGIVNHFDLKMTVGAAIAEPRIHHQWSPDRLLVENTLDPQVIQKLERLGHQVSRTSSVGVTQAIEFDPATGVFRGAHDPRVEGLAAGPK